MVLVRGDVSVLSVPSSDLGCEVHYFPLKFSITLKQFLSVSKITFTVYESEMCGADANSL